MNGQNVSPAIAFAEKLQKKYPLEVSIGVGIIIPNFVNGCSWGFVPDTNTEYVNYLDAIGSNQNMSSIKIKGGYLVNMNMDYLIAVLKDTAGGYITPRDLEIAGKHRTDALASLKSFMEKGKNGRIGIYNLNDTNSITVKGNRYSSFCVTMPDLLALCSKMGYGLVLGGKLRTPSEVAPHMINVVERLELAPSSNAMFIDIAKLR